MLTTVKAYSPWESAPTLLLDDNGRPETDLLQIRNIEGLDPVKAAINTAALGSVDGTAFIGANVNTARNIVLTIHPNPDWDDWTYDSLRNLIYVYFVPKKTVDLVFHSDDIRPVKISGYTEDVTLNPFSKDPEYQVSVICPDPYFTSLEPVVVEGLTNGVGIGGAPYPVVEYDGSMDTGMLIEIMADGTYSVDAEVQIQIMDPVLFGMKIRPVTFNANTYFALSSVPGDKYIRNINTSTGHITNLIPALNPPIDSVFTGWPYLVPGPSAFNFNIFGHDGGAFTDLPSPYKITYFERHIGL